MPNESNITGDEVSARHLKFTENYKQISIYVILTKKVLVKKLNWPL